MRSGVFALLFLLLAGAAMAADPDVLIVYDLSPMYETGKPVEDSTVAKATPGTVNCRSIAEAIAASLEEQHLKVRLASAAAIKDHRELLAARILVLGSPVRFSNVTWEMKKLFDDLFYRIYVSNRADFAVRKVAAFAMAENEARGKAAIETMRSAVEDCGGKLGETAVVIGGDSKTDAMKGVKDFAARLARQLQ